MTFSAAFPLARAALFRLDPEVAHAATMRALNAMAATGTTRLVAARVPDDPRTVMGIRFPNPVGLAAGADKNGECIPGYGALGFGFLELGGVTPLGQTGNPQPRVFRLPRARAVINRLGFNNFGVDFLLARLRAARWPGVIGVNLGKNLATPLERAADDYATCFEKLHAHVAFATINVSSPNTKNLRALQDEDALAPILKRMKRDQARLADRDGRYVPLSIKIAPDLDAAQVETVARLAVHHRIDAITATNTTVARLGVAGLPHAEETGGLSGAPVFEPSNRVIRELAHHLDRALPIIGVGGIMSGADARAKMEAGASLVQFYTGLIYRGPALIAEVASALRGR
ncbi:MAG: quinone-dependent dihydroorotate dehydrogenase [Burkholderiales bacterium]